MQAYHSGVFGDSGGGKTTLLRELAFEPGWRCRTVWVNHNDVSGLTGHGKRDAETVTTKPELRGSTAQVVNFKASDQLAGTSIAVEYAAEYYAECGVPVQVIVDEVHNIWPGKDAENHPIKWGLQEGRDRGVVMRICTQDPSDCKPYTPLKQVRNIAWCGEWSGWHDGFLNAHGWIPREKLPTKPFEYVVLDKRGNVQYRSETKKEYAS